MRSPLLFVLAAAVPLATFAIASCTGSSPDHGTGGTAGTAGTGAQGGSTPDASPDAAPDASPDAATDGPAPPPGCDVITLTTAVASTQMAHSEQYGPQPDLLATPEVGGTTGDPQHPNRLVFYLDGADAPGTYSVAAFTNVFYAIGNGGGLSLDYVEPVADGGTGTYSKRYVAVSGTVQVTAVLTPYQTAGSLADVRFAEATYGSDGSVKLTAGGACAWLAQASWDTRRAGGCAPFTASTKGQCPSGQYCMPTNAVGDDGLCVATGAKQTGDGCTLTSAGKWDSDCAPGLRCAEFSVDLGETSYTCHQLCDVLSASDGCAATSHCGGDYNVCIPNSFLLAAPVNGNEIDTVATVGQDCTQNPNALYCGATGTPGTCFQDTGAAAATCRPWVTAASACPAGDSGGYVAYKTGTDQSTLFCFH